MSHKTQMSRLDERLKRQAKLLVDVNTGFYLLDWFHIGLLMVPAVFFFLSEKKSPCFI